MPRNNGIDGSLGVTTVGHVEGGNFGFKSAIAESAGRCFEGLRASTIDDYGAAGLCQPLGHSEAESARGTGNKCNATIK